MKVFYYYYYLFYKKILNDDEPHLLATLALSASESFLINGILQILLLKFFLVSIDKWPMLVVAFLIIVANYLYFHRTGRAKEIIKTEPMFFSNNNFSILLTILFFIFTLSFILWETLYIMQIEEQCKLILKKWY